jgi:murein DD-endopeptidase MepM/ murein hydrolase activator NlpD
VYSPVTGQLDSRLNNVTSDISFGRGVNTSSSCVINVRYDNEAPLVGSSVSGVPTSTTGIGTRTGITNIVSSSYGGNSIVDFGNTGFGYPTSGLTAITKDTSVTATVTGESRADVVFGLKSGAFGLSDSNSDILVDGKLTSKTVVNGEISNPFASSSFVLAKNSTTGSLKNVKDEESSKTGVNGTSCVSVNSNAIVTSLGVIPAVANRRVGVCDDGLYSVNTYVVDTAGNVVTTVDGSGKRVPVLTSKVVERDTVSPAAATVVNTLSGGVLGQRMSLNISGEANTIANITINSVNVNNNAANTEMKYGYRLDSNGNYVNSDFLGKLICDTQYSIDVTLTDRAGNVSEVKRSIFNTAACPVCPTYKVIDKTKESIGAVVGTGVTGKYELPIKGYSKAPDVEQRYGATRTFNGKTYGHEGLDFDGWNDPKITPIAAGVVTESGYGVYGNQIRIDHNNGYSSLYGHLANLAVSKGSIVDINTYLGTAGNTGPYSVGKHLHLNIYKNSGQVDPMSVLGTSFTYKPIITSENSKYAVIQTTAGNMATEDAMSNGCEVPSLPSDVVVDGEIEGNFGNDIAYNDEYVSLKAEDDVVSIKEVKSNQVDISNLVNQIKNSLGEDFNFYFKLANNCDWANVGCHRQNAETLINRLKEFLENLIIGIKNGLIKASQNLVEEFQKLFNNLSNLINDPIKAVTEVVNEAKKIWDGIWELISNVANFVKVIAGNISDFFIGSSKDRIQALGKSLGLFLGERLINTVKGWLTGGPVAAIASVIMGIVTKAKEALSFVITVTKAFIGKIFQFGKNKIEAIFVNVGYKLGFKIKDTKKLAKHLSQDEFDQFMETLPKISKQDMRTYGEIAQYRSYFSRMVKVNPTEIRFSQNSTGNKTYNVLDSIKKNGWDNDEFISVVRMPDGKLTSLDNTRLVASKVNGNNLNIVEFAFDEVLHETRKGTLGNAQTFGEATLQRIKTQSGSFGKNNPYGSLELPKY